MTNDGKDCSRTLEEKLDSILEEFDGRKATNRQYATVNNLFLVSASFSIVFSSFLETSRDRSDVLKI